MSLKQRKIKFEPRIKLNHNIYIVVKKIACDPIRTGHALRLKQSAIDFCFYKFEAHISRVYRHLFFPKKNDKNVHTSNLYDRDSMCVLNSPRLVIAARL